MKKCSKCEINKPLTMFYKNKTNKDSLSSWCKPCQKVVSLKSVRVYNNTLEGKHTKERFKNKWGSGVYGIFENGVCLYIGESTSLSVRISNHKCYNTLIAPYLKKHPSHIIGILEQCSNHKEKEVYYISKYKPLYNQELLISYSRFDNT